MIAHAKATEIAVLFTIERLHGYNLTPRSQRMPKVPRNAFMLVVKRNAWLDSLTENETMTFIDTKELAEKVKVA